MKNDRIKTQKDLNEKMLDEGGMYYIALNGAVTTFSGKYSMTLFQAFDRMEQIAQGNSDAIKDAKKKGDRQELSELLDVAVTTYLVPYRIQ